MNIRSESALKRSSFEKLSSCNPFIIFPPFLPLFLLSLSVRIPRCSYAARFSLSRVMVAHALALPPPLLPQLYVTVPSISCVPRHEIHSKVMVAMLEHASLEIAALALNFWGLLGELLVETANGNAGGEQGQEGGQGQGPRSPALEESVRHACLVAMMRAQLPPTGEGGVGAWEDDAKDELENFREEVGLVGR